MMLLPWYLTYAEIPYDVMYDEEIMGDKLPTYDWLHLHHEDFTGQYGRFLVCLPISKMVSRTTAASAEATARRLGFNKVSEFKLGSC
jgi:hypothetical protein